MSGLNLLSRDNPGFPPVHRALEDPNGLLAVGGALTADWLITAYRHGIFPWFDDDAGPILWWSPDPRAVIVPDRVRITKSLAKRLRNTDLEVTVDTAFAAVIEHCAAERSTRGGAPSGTWITTRMQHAYQELFELGLAHSVEIWRPDDGGTRALVGGLYGISLGRMFFGESMFSRQADASKIALCHLARQLVEWDFWLIDCQVANPHLTSLGAIDLPREQFVALVEKNAHQPTLEGRWQLDHFEPASWRATRSGTTPPAGAGRGGGR